MATRERDGSGTWIEQGPLEIRTQHDADDVYVLALFGELDLAGVDVLTDAMLQAEATEVRQIVVDLSGLEFIDSTGLVALCAAQERSRQDANRLVFMRGAGSVEQVMELTQMDSILRFAD